MFTWYYLRIKKQNKTKKATNEQYLMRGSDVFNKLFETWSYFLGPEPCKRLLVWFILLRKLHLQLIHTIGANNDYFQNRFKWRLFWTQMNYDSVCSRKKGTNIDRFPKYKQKLTIFKNILIQHKRYSVCAHEVLQKLENIYFWEAKKDESIFKVIAEEFD